MQVVRQPERSASMRHIEEKERNIHNSLVAYSNHSKGNMASDPPENEVINFDLLHEIIDYLATGVALTCYPNHKDITEEMTKEF